MTETINIFTGSNGLNTEIDPVRLPFDPGTGVQDLAVAYNVDHDASGRISRRKGFSATARTEDIHSLWCDGGECLFVTGAFLCVLKTDYTYTPVASVTPNAWVSYIQVHNRAYWANGLETGYVQDSVNNTWEAGTYNGPETTRQYTGPPVGNRLGYYGGSVFVIQGRMAWFSEPFALNLFDLVRDYYMFQTNIRMFQPVADGVFVSTERSIYFLGGPSSRNLTRVKKADYPAIEWTDSRFQLEVMAFAENFIDVGAIWTSTDGICVGLPGGRLINLTESKVSYPSALRGAGLVLGKRYVSTLEP